VTSDADAVLHDVLLTFDGIAHQMARACGRNGAPRDLARARELVPEMRAALVQLERALLRHRGSGS
jgi:hypothetical protein